MLTVNFSTIITSILRIIYLLTVNIVDITCKSYETISFHGLYKYIDLNSCQTLSPPLASGPMSR